MIKFGSHLRDLRKLKGISLRDLSALIGLSPAYICRIEQGQRRPPSEEVIKRIAQALDADEDELINLAGNVPIPLKSILKDSPLAVELVRVLSERKLPDETYCQMLYLIQESGRSA